MIIDFSLILKSIPYVLSGLPYTLGISLLSFMVGNVFAIILAFMRMSQKPWLKYPARVYISIMRGVPMLVVPLVCLTLVFSCLPFFVPLLASPVLVPLIWQRFSVHP